MSQSSASSIAPSSSASRGPGRSPLFPRPSVRPTGATTPTGPTSPTTTATATATSAVRLERPTSSSFTEYFIVLTALVALLLAVDAFFVSEQEQPKALAITQHALRSGLSQCAAVELDANTCTRAPRSNPRVAANPPPPLLVKHATLWDGSGARHPDVDIAAAFGVILKVAPGLTPADVSRLAKEHAASQGIHWAAEDAVLVWDADHRVVSPGIVDMHSHVGTQSVPGFDAEQDTNESQGGPLMPQLQIIDAFNPLDPAIATILSGGVTTSLVIPGSGPLMGGEGIAIKMASANASSNSVHDFLLNKGMNPKKRQKQGVDDDPHLGLADDGKEWRWIKMACGENPKGHDWGDLPSSRLGSGWMFRKRLEEARSLLRRQVHFYSHQSAIESRISKDLKQDSLVALLRGNVKLQVHCYQVNDIDMMLRNKEEFGFEIAAFHHATEAHLLGEQTGCRQISLSQLFADHSLYKREAYKHSVLAGQILHKAGVQVAYKSDHPVTNAQNLIYEAQKAVHYGLDEEVAFKAVTSVPADLIGAGHRIGRIAEGYDADIVIWDRPPLQLGAHPSPCLLDSYTVSNISRIFASETSNAETDKLVVEKGIISCIGNKCESKGFVFDLKQGVIIPGLIAASVPIGLQEIGQEQGTWDGVGGTADAVGGFVYAKDGLRVGGESKLQEYAWKSGVLTAVSVPKGSGLVVGVSTAFRTGAQLYRDAIVVPDVGLHINLGDNAKESYAPSISVQFAKLRSLLTSPPPNSPFAQVVAGKLPLIAIVHDPNDISKLINMTSAFQPALKLVVAGATGAWAQVLLQPPRCQPYSWEQRWCKALLPGVKVAVSVKEADQVRSLWIEAGWATVGDSNGGKVDVVDAVGAVTWRVADAFFPSLSLGASGASGSGLGRLVVGSRASFVGLNGGPVGFGHHVQILGDGVEVTTLPKQD
ncbi:hypothetical protein BDR26DRAFT_870060, partial [Obelidium mucronatum]